MAIQESRVDALVVGAGPVGLMMASELRRHGIECRIVDKVEEATTQSRATDIQPRTMEVMYALGLADEMVERGHRTTGACIYAGGERLVAGDFGKLETPYPFILGIPQPETEGVLRRNLERLGGRVEYGLELARFKDEGESVTATLLKNDGTWEKVRTRWLLGCDGANSSVRQAQNLSFEGISYDENFLLADVHLETTLSLDVLHVFYGEDGGLLCILPMPGRSNARIFASIEADEDPELTLETFSKLLTRRSAGAFEATMTELTWASRFRIHKRMVPKYRNGRVFLAGDAAHIHSPISAQGLNLGVQDSYNLAWKLALVHKGRARAELLDSYHPERSPLAELVLSESDKQTKMGLIKSRFGQGVRTQFLQVMMKFPSLAQRSNEEMAGLSWNYRSSPIVAEDRGSVFGAKLVEDRTTETPTFRDWMDFGSAPAAGNRAPDVQTVRLRLFDVIRNTAHTLLLFDGRAPTDEGYERLARIASRVSERFGDVVQPHIVVFGKAPSSLAWSGPTSVDDEGKLHARYGAGAECLYLVRPDGYIAYRSQPADEQKLFAYLERIFV